MRKRYKPKINVTVYFFLALLLTGCSSMVQKSGELLEGSAFGEKTIAVYSSAAKGRETKIELKKSMSKTGEETIEISNSAWPGLSLRGEAARNNGSFEFKEARILSPHLNGWNEFSLELLGSAAFTSGLEQGGVLRIAGEVERVQISSGKIRLKSSRLTGNAALVPLRNRRERILVLTQWMHEEENAAGANLAAFANQKEFENYWKPRLFPELVLQKKRPQVYTTKNAEWHREDGVKWNRTYTELFFPEELWDLRNSGALLRDWEEALPWIFIEYSWKRIIDSIDETELLKKGR
jgi:hypothetical protein